MNILLTGGAGFIGSNLVEHWLTLDWVTKVRVLDNLSSGSLENIQPFLGNPKFEFVEGDIRNPEDCVKAAMGMDAISHQAARGSVPRSIKDPVTTHDVNVTGFINVLEAARKAGIKNMVYASSSSVYGDSPELPKVEGKEGKVLSPYAASKKMNEIYADAYARCYDMQLTGLRYFNVFGPRQSPNGPYAAVIPKFIQAALNNENPVINGDGTTSRDFTFVERVVDVNTLAIQQNVVGGKHEVFNVACGKAYTLTELWEMIKEVTGSKAEAIYGDFRAGDIKHSLASIEKLQANLAVNNDIASMQAGLAITFQNMKY